MALQRLFKHSTLWLLGLGLAASTAGAQLPVPELMAAGEYPSLAPMIERTAPAVVNIRVKGSRAVAANPLAQDPFFRRFIPNPNEPLDAVTAVKGDNMRSFCPCL